MDGLTLVGEDFWLERKEYDGQEWWEYKTTPIKPEKSKELLQVKNNDDL